MARRVTLSLAAASSGVYKEGRLKFEVSGSSSHGPSAARGDAVFLPVHMDMYCIDSASSWRCQEVFVFFWAGDAKFRGSSGIGLPRSFAARGQRRP